MKVRMKVEITGWYEIETDGAYSAYGTDDPVKMAAVDEENDVGLLLAECQDVRLKITPES